MTSLRAIADAMGGEVHGNHAAFPTPGHSKGDRGTVARLDPDAPDGVLIHSHNGGDWREIKETMRSKGVLSQREPSCSEAWRRTGTFTFRDEAGSILYRTHRLEHPSKRKRYEADRPDGNGGWIPNVGDGRRVLYRLPELLAAGRDTVVFLVEGERKADKLAAWGLTATAIAFGAKSWRGEYATALAGRTVAILPDNDDEGRGFSERAAKSIADAGGRAVLIDLPGLPPKGDVMDWQGDAATLRALVDAAVNPRAALLPLIDMAGWNDPAPDRQFAWGSWIPLRQTTMLTGDGGTGKSLLTQMLLTCIAIGAPFLGMETRQGACLYLTAEDDAEELWRRQRAICAALRIPLAAVLGKLHVVSLAGEADTALATFDASGKMTATERWRQVRATVDALNIRYAAFDTATDTMGGDHNDIHQVAAFVNLLTGLAIERDGASLILHHPNKAGDDWLGSIAWHNKVRSRLIMKRPDGCDPDARTIENPKANYGPSGEKIEFRWYAGAFVRDDELPPDKAVELRESAVAAGDNILFLACLDERNRQERPVSESKASRTYAPKEFAEMAESKRIGRERLERAMDRLFRIGVIERGFVFRDKHEGKDRHGLRRADIRPAPADFSADRPLTSPPSTRRPPANVPADPLAHTPPPKGGEGAPTRAAAPSLSEGQQP